MILSLMILKVLINNCCLPTGFEELGSSGEAYKANRVGVSDGKELLHGIIPWVSH